MIKSLIAAALLVSNVGLDWLNSKFNTYDKIQKEVHALAEPGFMEHKSNEILIKHLEENGFKVERGVAGMPTAFVASFGSGKPVMAVLAELDALPGLSQDATPKNSPMVEGGYGHGCGHNLIGTGALAAAVAVSKWMCLIAIMQPSAMSTSPQGPTSLQPGVFSTAPDSRTGTSLRPRTLASV